MTKAMRALGVQRYELDGVVVEFGGPPPQRPLPPLEMSVEEEEGQASDQLRREYEDVAYHSA